MIQPSKYGSCFNAAKIGVKALTVHAGARTKYKGDAVGLAKN